MIKNDGNRLDYVWAAVVAKNYLDGIHENYHPQQAADAAVKRADQAESIVDSVGTHEPSPGARLDLIWALVAAAEFQRHIEGSGGMDPDGTKIRATADRAVTEVSKRPSIRSLLEKA